MKKAIYDFPSPKIVGAIGDLTMEPAVAKNIERQFKNAKINAVCLPFHVENKYLKNTVACMKLMDIIAIFVHNTHEKKMLKWISKTDAMTQKCGFVDFISRDKKTFQGRNLWIKSVLQLLEENINKRIFVVGNNFYSKCAIKVLSKYKPQKILNPKNVSLKELGSESVVLNFSETKLRGAKIITQKEIDKLRNIMIADIISSVI